MYLFNVVTTPILLLVDYNTWNSHRDCAVVSCLLEVPLGLPNSDYQACLGCLEYFPNPAIGSSQNNGWYFPPLVFRSGKMNEHLAHRELHLPELSLWYYQTGLSVRKLHSCPVGSQANACSADLGTFTWIANKVDAKDLAIGRTFSKVRVSYQSCLNCRAGEARLIRSLIRGVRMGLEQLLQEWPRVETLHTLTQINS